MGAGLLAKAVCQLMKGQDVPTLSRASPLPQEVQCKLQAIQKPCGVERVTMASTLSPRGNAP